MAELRSHADAAAFLERAKAWLQKIEAAHHAILSVACMLRGDSHFEPPFLLATVESGDAICGCAIRAVPDGLYVTDLPRDVVPALVAKLRTLYTELPEIIGPEPVATAVAERWRPGAWAVHARLNCYVMHAVTVPSRSPGGTLRAGTADDLSLLHRWAPDYASEVATRVDMRSLFERMLERGLLYLWDDGGPRCVVTTSKLTADGAEVSALYTPPHDRGRGYATSAVAAASQRVLDSGRRYCMIAADQDAPLPNRIYRRIGYRPIGELAVVHISSPA